VPFLGLLPGGSPKSNSMVRASVASVFHRPRRRRRSRGPRAHSGWVFSPSPIQSGLVPAVQARPCMEEKATERLRSVVFGGNELDGLFSAPPQDRYAGIRPHPDGDRPAVRATKTIERTVSGGKLPYIFSGGRLPKEQISSPLAVRSELPVGRGSDSRKCPGDALPRSSILERFPFRSKPPRSGRFLALARRGKHLAVGRKASGWGSPLPHDFRVSSPASGLPEATVWSKQPAQRVCRRGKSQHSTAASSEFSRMIFPRPPPRSE